MPSPTKSAPAGPKRNGPNGIAPMSVPSATTIIIVSKGVEASTSSMAQASHPPSAGTA